MQNPFHTDPFFDYLNQSLRITSQTIDDYRLRKAVQKKRYVTLSPSLPLDCAATAFIEGLQRQVDIHNLSIEQLPFAETQYNEGAVRSAIGTVRHTLIQQFAGIGGQILGDWVCQCGEKRFGSYKQCKERDRCQLQYKEPGFQYSYKGRVRMTGKVDGIWIDAEGGQWLIDYKFVNEWKLHSVRKKPDPGYRRQLGRYAVAFRKRLKRLAGYKIVYQDSAQPMPSHKNTWIDSVELYRDDLDRLEQELHAELDKRAVGADHAVNCMKTGELDKSVIKEIKAHKACADREFYEKHVKTPFYECPLADQCLGNKLGKALRQHFEKAQEATSGSV